MKGWTTWPFKVPSNLGCSMVLWFSSFWENTCTAFHWLVFPLSFSSFGFKASVKFLNQCNNLFAAVWVNHTVITYSICTNCFLSHSYQGPIFWGDNRTGYGSYAEQRNVHVVCLVTSDPVRIKKKGTDLRRKILVVWRDGGNNHTQQI